MTVRGKALTSEEKTLVVSIKKYFDQCKHKTDIKEPSVQKTADAICVGVATVKRIMADYNRDPKLLEQQPNIRGRRPYAIDVSYQENVRSYIREANSHGNYITLNDISRFLVEIGASESFHVSTLARTLDRWGFEFGVGTRTQHLKEKDYVVAARQRYLRQMRANRVSVTSSETFRPEVYLDESYVNKNHSNDFIWYSGDDGAFTQKPTGKGERLIIINAITKDGWVPGAKLVFKSNRKTGDYHGQMNFELFAKWFKQMLIPNIPDNSIIVMDNASYHNILSSCSAPTSTCSKSKIKTWLEKNNISCREDCLKAEMVENLRKIAPAPSYAIDEIASDYGYDIIRTPPYHPELQPIETCWGVVKNHIARNCDFTMNNLIEQLENGFEKVTKKTCLKIIAKVRRKENLFWDEDIRQDN